MLSASPGPLFTWSILFLVPGPNSPNISCVASCLPLPAPARSSGLSLPGNGSPAAAAGASGAIGTASPKRPGIVSGPLGAVALDGLPKRSVLPAGAAGAGSVASSIIF